MQALCRVWWLAAMVAAAWLLPAPPVLAQVQRVAAIVNDEVISIYDLDRRLQLVLHSTRLEDTVENRRRLANQVLRSLVDERLQIQEAQRNNITASDADFKRAISFLERQNGIPPGKFDEAVKQDGIDRDSLMSQIRAEIVWNKLLLQRMRSAAEVSDEEVDEQMKKIRDAQGRVEQLVSEIFLPLDSADQEEEVHRSALRLVEQIRAGAPFQAVARQFSRGSTANQGGDVGWVSAGQLPDEVDRLAQELPVGQTSDPIRMIGGFEIIQVRDRRKGLTSSPGGNEIELQQILLAMAPSAPQAEVDRNTQLAKTISEAVEGCDKVEAAGKQYGAPESGSLGRVRPNDLPESFRAAVANAPIGKFVGPVRTNAGLHLLMVCSRAEVQPAGLPSREQVADRLMQQRLSMFGRRYLRDLRRTAVVEVR